jgi:hypothetical protein
VAGNDKALAIVRVPTQAEEQKGAHKPQRQQLRDRQIKHWIELDEDYAWGSFTHTRCVGRGRGASWW